MQATVNHAELQRALKITGKSCARRPTLPVLAGARLKVSLQTGDLEVTTTDLELTTRTILRPSFSVTGAVVVPLQQLAAALKGKAPKGATVTLTETHDGKSGDALLRVQVGAMVASIRLLDAGDYPTMDHLNEQPGDQLVTDELAEIRTWAERVLPATSDDEARPVLTAVLIERKGRQLTAVACDSYRLHVYQTRYANLAPEFAFLLPRAALKLAHDAMKAHKATTGAMWWRQIGETSGYVRMQVGPTTIVARAVEGTFPDFEQLMPKTDGTHVISINDASAAAEALKLAETHARTNSGTVVLEHGLAGAVLSSVSVQDVGTLELPIPGMTAPGPDPFDTIAFNPRFLREMVTANGDGTMHVLSPLKPALFGNSNGFRGLLMPVRLPA